MRALGFIGASRLASAERLLPEVIRQWAEQWSFHGAAAPECSCAAESAEVLTLTNGANWQQADGGTGRLWLSARWQQIVFGPYAADAPQDQIGAQLLLAAQQALTDSLLAVLGRKAGPLHDGKPVGLGAPLSPRLMLRASFGPDDLLLIMDANLLDNFLPPVTRARPPLQNRRTAIGGAKLTLRVSLPFSSLSVGKASTLSPGDILQSDAHFLEPLNLTIQDQPPVAKGFLARRDTHLALQLTAHEQ